MANTKHTYKTVNVCAPSIDFEVDEEGLVHNVKFGGGCAGNTGGLSSLLEGMPKDVVIKKLKGTQCRNGTSCPDQLAKALESVGD